MKYLKTGPGKNRVKAVFFVEGPLKTYGWESLFLLSAYFGDSFKST